MMRILRTISDSIDRIQGGWKMYTAENIRKNRQLYIPIWATMTVDCGGTHVYISAPRVCISNKETTRSTNS
jgi:hypothetical protein